MTILSKLLVPLDGSPASARALPVAVALAAQMKIPTTLLTVVTSDTSAELARERLAADAARLPDGADVEVVRGSSVRTVLLGRLAVEPDALVVMATHAPTAVGKLFLGSISDDAVQQATGPIILIGPRAASADPLDRFDRVIACVDESPECERLAPLLAELSGQLTVDLTLLGVVAPARGRRRDGSSVEVVAATPVQTMGRRMRELDVVVDEEVLVNDHPAQAIVEFAVSPRSIIAIATRGRDPHERLREASLAVSVIRQATCPVLLYGPSVR